MLPLTIAQIYRPVQQIGQLYHVSTAWGALRVERRFSCVSSASPYFTVVVIPARSLKDLNDA
jgi:hypothetical protein